MRKPAVVTAVVLVVALGELLLCAQAAISWNRLFGAASGEGPERCACSCGIPNRRSRVVGGSFSEFNEYPWQVALMYKGHFYCGGTLISDRYVLTAAHCIKGVSVHNLRVTVGDHIRSFPIETRSKEYQAVYSVYHSGFNRSTYNHDIGLLKLSHKVDYMWYSRPACLPLPETDYVGELGVVTGWGRVSEKGNPTDTLKEALVPIFSNAVCRALRYHPYEITDNMFCAGYVNGGTDSCHGDSGGGLLWEGSDGKMDVVGVRLRTVQQLVKQFRNSGEAIVPTPLPRPGRPRMTTFRIHAVISRQASKDPRLTALELKEKNPRLLTNVSIRCCVLGAGVWAAGIPRGVHEGH